MARQSPPDASETAAGHQPSPSYLFRSIAAAGVAMLSVIGVGVLDYLTTPSVALGVLYLLAIALAAWKVNRTTGLVVAMFALVTWAVVDGAAGVLSPSPWLILWNVTARGITFACVALLVSALCDQQARQVAINEQLRESLDAAERSAAHIKELQGELQLICSWTNRIRSEGRWMRFEEFMKRNFQMEFTHGISADAAERLRERR
jgi:low affinity Fe/Cu permease